MRELPASERDALALVGVLSVLAVPIFVDGRWWGFIGFEDCEHERDWSAAETDALRAAAGLVAAAISRERAERDLRRRDAILQAVSHGAGRLVADAELAGRGGRLAASGSGGGRREPGVPVRERRPRRRQAESRASGSSGSRTGPRPSSTTR